MAAVLGKDLLTKQGIPHVIISCGTMNLTGRRAAAHAQQAVADWGLSLESHRAQGINTGLVKLADIIFVMAPKHRTKIVHYDPSLEPRIVNLWEHHPNQTLTQIDDPVGQELDTFRTCRDIIQECLKHWFNTHKEIFS